MVTVSDALEMFLNDRYPVVLNPWHENDRSPLFDDESPMRRTLYEGGVIVGGCASFSARLRAALIAGTTGSLK